MKEPKPYDSRKDGFTLQVLHTDSKYNKDKILKINNHGKIMYK